MCADKSCMCVSLNISLVWSSSTVTSLACVFRALDALLELQDTSRAYWRVLKIDGLNPSELNVREDSTTYSKRECSDLLRRIHEGNKSTGGLKFVTTCYGIVGFIKLLGLYYMLLITKRREFGAICGHTVYATQRLR